MQRFSRVDKEGGSAGTGKGGGQLFTDMAGFAHPGYDQFAFAVENGFGGLNKGLVKTVWEAAGFL